MDRYHAPKTSFYRRLRQTNRLHNVRKAPLWNLPKDRVQVAISLPTTMPNQSKAPNSCPHRTPEEFNQRLLELKRQHPKWGAKKLLAILKKRDPQTHWPTVTTVQDLLQRNGLTQQHTKRRKTNQLLDATAPNDVWATFPTRDGKLCYPLTVIDSYKQVEGSGFVSKPRYRM